MTHKGNELIVVVDSLYFTVSHGIMLMSLFYSFYGIMLMSLQFYSFYGIMLMSSFIFLWNCDKEITLAKILSIKVTGYFSIRKLKSYP